jgi:pyrroline-5-carboxylate reductase
MDMCFRKIWISLKSFVDVLSCNSRNDHHEIELMHGPSTPNACPPSDVEIIGEDEKNRNQLLKKIPNKLEHNISFFPSIKQLIALMIPPLDMFGYLYLETQNEPKFSIIGEPSSSKQENIQPSYAKKVSNTYINLEKTYGKGFTILSKKRCDKTRKHETNQLFDHTPTHKNIKGLGY